MAQERSCASTRWRNGQFEISILCGCVRLRTFFRKIFGFGECFGDCMQGFRTGRGVFEGFLVCGSFALKKKLKERNGMKFFLVVSGWLGGWGGS